MESALNDPQNSLIIRLEDNEGKIQGQRIAGPFLLPSLTLAEINYEVFHVVSNDYHSQLYSYVQKLIGNKNIQQTDEYIINSTAFDKKVHSKNSNYKSTIYKTLPTYIRNAINHPNNGNKFTDEELCDSINLLRNIIKVSY